MSWFSKSALRARCGAGALAAVAFALSGCGLHPLYGKTNAEVVPELQSIKIASIADRIGQELRNLLYTQLTPGGEPAQPKYRLDTTLRESKQSQAIQQNEVATRANLGIIAHYSLIEIGTGRVLTKYVSSATVSYDIVQSEFATLSAQKDAERRALREIGDDMSVQLSFYFTQEQNKQTTANPPPAYPQPAYSQPAYSQPAYPQATYPQPAYSQPTYPQPAYSQPAYPQATYPPAAYPQPAYPPATYPPATYPPASYPQAPYPQAPYPP
jgi:LPS-assembly lipoprotein